MINRFLSITKLVWVPIAWTLLLFILLFLPGNDLPPTPKWWKFPGYDKVIHWGLFGMFTALWILYFIQKRDRSVNIYIGVITFLSIILGIATEFIQLYYIPNRSFDLYDIVADIVGSITAAVIIFVYSAKLLRKE